MGFGMQKWLYTMKPRKFMGKRTKSDGGGVEGNYGPNISDYYHLKSNKLENLLKKKFSAVYRKKLESEIKEENRKQIIFNIISLFIAIILIIALLAFLSVKFDLI